MKIVVTSKGKDLDSELDSRFGRALHFIVFDTDTNEFRAVDNSQNLNAVQGAGIQAAENVSASGAKHLITGNCGPKAFRVLHAVGITVFLCKGGTVKEAIQKFQAGELEEANQPNVGGHW